MSSSRSHHVDYTYLQINAILTGSKEGLRPRQLAEILESRADTLKKHYEPYDPPCDASRKVIESGSVILPDGVSLTVEESDKVVVFAISKHLHIDEVDALVLLRSFLYNEGLPQTSESEASSLVEEVLQVITPFYYSERLSVTRTLTSLFGVLQNPDHPFHDIAKRVLPQIVPEPVPFAQDVIAQYCTKAKKPIPEHLTGNIRRASLWARQNAKEQLVLLELIFWTMWEYVPCNAPIVTAVYEAAYEVEFGYKQENSTALLDDEGRQIQQDLASFWVMLTVEVLNLELVSGHGVELALNPVDDGPFPASPRSLEKVHRLVMAHSHPGYVCTMLAWALYLKAISSAASLLAERPPAYVPFLREIKSSQEVAYRKGEKELHATIVEACLRPEAGLFAFLHTLLTESPVFSTAATLKLGSEVTDPNAVAYRSVLKGLVMTLADYEPVELVPDFEGLVEVWIALFGHSESTSVSGLCRQYWDFDWKQGISRRGIIDFARTRFPVQLRPLIRLMRCMTGAGFSESLLSSDRFTVDKGVADVDRQVCSSYVFHYLSTLPSYTQVISVTARSGATAVFDRMIDRSRPTSSSASGGTAYTNHRPVTLPGGSVLPQKTVGRLLCPDSSNDPVIVAWEHQHSGWKVLVDVLVEYVYRRQGTATRNRDQSGRRQDGATVLQLDDVGIERNENEDLVVADTLELVLCVIQGSQEQMEMLMQSLEQGGQPVSHKLKDTSPPDLVQIIFMILEDELSRSSRSRRPTPRSLVSPALSILSALLSLPAYSTRIWLYLRTSTMLFGSERDTNFVSSILSAERSSGSYAMTHSLLRLIRSLFEEAIASLLLTQTEQPRLHAVKDEVLCRAVRFVHGSIWVDYSGWRYQRLGDRFELGREVVMLYLRTVETMSSVSTAHAFAGMSRLVSEMLLEHATAATISPLVQVIASGRMRIQSLMKMRRFSESSKLVSLLEVCLRLARLLLNLKETVAGSEKLTLLEHMLCSDVTVRSSRMNPVDAMGSFVKERDVGPNIPRESIQVLAALCSSLSLITPSPPSLIGCFTDAQAIMSSFIRIVRHPYDDLTLRNAIWNFIAVAVEKQPALAVLFVSGQFKIQSVKGKEKAVPESTADEKLLDLFARDTKSSSAVEAACDALSGWSALWESNPHLLASVLNFLHVVWTRSLEHLYEFEPTKGNSEFWKQISSLATQNLGPSPNFVASKYAEDEEGMHSDLHDAVSNYAVRAKVKALALRIIATDTAMHIRSNKGNENIPKSASFTAFNSAVSWDDLLSTDFSDAVHNSFDPTLQDELVSTLKTSFSSMSVETLRKIEPMRDREFGDNFMLSIPLWRDIVRNASRLNSEMEQKAEGAKFLVYSVNLNMSLAQSEYFLSQSWCSILENIRGYLRQEKETRSKCLAMASAISRQIADERRSGDFMYTVHGGRLQALLRLLEVPWFHSLQGDSQSNLLSVVKDLADIISSEVFSPARSILGQVTNPFHQSLLQLIYFCGRICRTLDRQQVKAEQRLIIGGTFTVALNLIIDALRVTFDSARTRLDLQLDSDIQLLVAAFQQCTPSSLFASSNVWLTKLQETDVIGASFSLLRGCDIAGLSDVQALRSSGRALYSPHVFIFHMVLASIPFTSERLASEGLIAVYSNISISSAISDGLIDVSLPELPGERSPAHRAYCYMLTNIAGMISCMASPSQLIESQIVGVVQLYGKQISRALSWNNDEPLTPPYLEELELTCQLFYLVANGSTITSRTSGALHAILRAFTDHALQLLQQLNYALTHPKHLVGLVEAVTTEERLRLEKENYASLSLNTLTDLLDGAKRPMITGIVHRLFVIAATLSDALGVIGGAEQVILSDSEEWPVREAVVVLHSKVTVNEPASVGTLLELGNCMCETLQFLSSQGSQGQSLLAPKANATPSVPVGTVRHALESLLVYAVTQLVMWLSKHEDEHTTADMDQDELTQQDLSLSTTKERDRRMKRKSLSLADRMRRGMTGEMTSDLKTLVTKSKEVISKVDGSQAGQKMIDITQFLSGFMEERISGS